jgi:hypothetical protein
MSNFLLSRFKLGETESQFCSTARLSDFRSLFSSNMLMGIHLENTLNILYSLAATLFGVLLPHAAS